MTKEQRIAGSDRFSFAQLFGIMAEHLFDPASAQEQYNALKKTELWDPETNQWNWRMTKEQELADSDRYSYDQLLSIMAEHLFDPASSQEQYNALKKTALWDQETNQWNWYMTKEQAPVNSNRYSDTQLLGIMAEHLFDPASAQEQYNALKKTELWDPETNQWNWGMTKEQRIANSNRPSFAQLLGIMAEHLFEKKGTKKETSYPLPRVKKF
jgi:hypothetical protein